MGPDGSSNSMAKPRVVGLVLSEMVGLPPPIENRAVIGTGRVKCGALDRLGASGDGVKTPLTQTPLAPLARTPLWFPLTANRASTIASTPASSEEPGCVWAPCPGASTVGVVWANAVPASRQANAVAQEWVTRFDTIGLLPERSWTALQTGANDCTGRYGPPSTRACSSVRLPHPRTSSDTRQRQITST